MGDKLTQQERIAGINYFVQKINKIAQSRKANQDREDAPTLELITADLLDDTLTDPDAPEVLKRASSGQGNGQIRLNLAHMAITVSLRDGKLIETGRKVGWRKIYGIL